MLILRGFVWLLVATGALMVAYAAVSIVVSIVRTALNPDEGLHAFRESFGSEQFEDPHERAGRGRR